MKTRIAREARSFDKGCQMKETDLRKMNASSVTEIHANVADLYFDDPVGFANDIIGLKFTSQQLAFASQVACSKKKRLAAKSGHGTGKTKMLAALGWWFLVTRFKPVIPATAPTSHQLFDCLWKELAWCKGQMPPALGNMFEMLTDRIYYKPHKEEWYLQARTARRGHSDALQGFHGDSLLYMVEEASGVEDEIFQPVEGALTQEDNRLVIIGNPTKTSGYFYDAFNKFASEFDTFTFSSLDSPLYDQKTAQSLIRRYGLNSAIVRVRVLGEFPYSEPDQIIPIDVILDAVGRDCELFTPVIWGLDLARQGDDESVLAKRHGQVILPIDSTCWREPDSVVLERKIIGEYHITAQHLRPIKIFVDAHGLGGPIFDHLKAAGLPVVPVNVQAPAFSEDFKDAKAEMYFKVKEELVNHRLSLPDDPELIGQMSTLKYTLDKTTGKTMVISKQDMKTKYNVGSPDRFEAVAFTYYEPVIDVDQGDYDEDEEWRRRYAKKQKYAYDYDEFNLGL